MTPLSRNGIRGIAVSASFAILLFMATIPHLLLLNASRMGGSGNTAEILRRVQNQLEGIATSELLILKESTTADALQAVSRCDALIIGTGTHWDSWSSTLQQFLEEATPSEGTATWLGKPVGIAITEHSVGGKGVLSRLQGVLNTFGCWTPPMCGMVYSLAAQNSLENQAPGSNDLWCLDDLSCLTQNIIQAAKVKVPWQSWPVDREDFERVWVQPKGP